MLKLLFLAVFMRQKFQIFRNMSSLHEHVFCADVEREKSILKFHNHYMCMHTVRGMSANYMSLSVVLKGYTVLHCIAVFMFSTDVF